MLPVGWSNPQGEILTQVRENVWLAERPFFPRIPGLSGTDVGGKMACVRLPDGSLWIHSPVELDEILSETLRALGPVKHIVTPNTEHQKYAQQWLLAYPDARGYACPGLRKQRPEIGWTSDVGVDIEGRWTAEAPAAWGGVFDLCWIDAERGPFMDRPFFSEVVFCHRPSKILFTTDLYWNYPTGTGVPFSTKLWKIGMDRIYAPFYNKFMQIKPDFRTRLETIMRWDFDYIAPCHGNPIDTAVKATLAEHLGFPGYTRP